MSTESERQDFTKRLQWALCNANYFGESATQLAREFNARFGGKSITVHAARKWLMGESIPTQDKLQVLANWLEVRAEWLRFGDEKSRHPAEPVRPRRPESDGVRLINDLLLLDEHHQRLAFEFIRLLAQNADVYTHGHRPKESQKHCQQ